MENDTSIIEQLKVKNQELYLNKRIIDLDSSIESLLLFYNNYTSNLATDVSNQISSFYGIDSNSDQGKIMYNTISSFFVLCNNKLKDVLTKKIEKIKSTMNNVSDEEYNKELRYMSIKAINAMSDYYFQNIDMLIKELVNESTDLAVNNKINSYFYETLYYKMMNVLRDQFSYSVKVIGNNNDENIQVMQNINEKTIK